MKQLTDYARIISITSGHGWTEYGRHQNKVTIRRLQGAAMRGDKVTCEPFVSNLRRCFYIVMEQHS
jgi:hypothetical protein